MTEQNNDIRNTFGGIAEQYHQLRRRVEKIERSPADLRNAAIDGGRGLTIKSDAETIRFGDNGFEHLDGPAPEQPEAPFVDTGGESVKIQLSGLDAYGYPAQRNFKQAHIHVSHDDVFEPSRSTFAGYVAQADGSMTHRLPGGEWHVGVVWENMSGVLSPMSDATLADVEPLVDTDDIEEALDTAQERLDDYRENVAAPRFQQLEEGLGENTESLSAAEKRLTAAEETLAPLPGKVDEARDFADGAIEEATTASAAAVEANNRSMTRLANGNFESGLDYWEHNNVTLSSVAHSGSQSALIDGWLRPGSSFPVVPDQIWELSLYHQYDVSVEFQAVDGATLETFHLDGGTTWADSGTLRVTVPAGVDMLSFTITGDSALVDDVTLRDVTDVVRLEQAANANRQKAEQAISELAVLQLAVDGEGGLKDRLQSAETVLETKADTSALSELDEKLGRDLAQIESHYTKVWRQDTPPPAGVHYAWLGEPHASESVMLDTDGNELARNLVPTPNFEAVAPDPYNPAHQIERSAERAYIGTHSARAFDQDGGYNRLGARWTVDSPGGHSIAKIWVYVPSTNGSNATGVRFQWGASETVHFTVPVVDEWFQAVVHVAAQDEYSGSFWVGVETTGNAPGDHVFLDGAQTAVADSEDAALAQVESYFDGSTASDRAHDLWYNADGVPHEWVNGQGWTVLDDQRLASIIENVDTLGQELDTAKETLSKKADTSALSDLAGNVTANATAIGEAQESLTAAEQDLETALTGEIDHDRLRVGTGAFDQAFVARLVADSVSAMSAEFEQLTVAELANFAKIIGDEIWAELGVFGKLDAREAYVGGAHLKDGAVTAEKMTITGDLAAAIVSADKARIAELLADEVWAKLGVFNRIDAREAYVGGAHLKDGAVTAEKIEATRELITKIMGAEWAYISERLVVDGDLIANNIDAISAAIATLSVTERADFTKTFAEEMWAELGVFDKLQAQEAWIGGALIQEGAIDVAKINVTEQLTAAIAQFLEIEAGMIKANAVDADAIAAGSIDTDHLSGRIIKGEHIQGDTFTGETFDGGTFTGSTFQTDSLPNHGLKFSADGIHGWGDNGEKTLQITGEISKDMKDPDAGNFLTGRFYTNGKDLPGIILNPDYGPDSHQGPGVWFSEDGWVDASQPAIWVNKSDFYNITIRGKRWDNGSRSHVELQGGINVTEGGVIVDNGTVQSNYGSFRRIEASGQADFRSTSYFHGTMRYPGKLERTGSSNVQIYSSHDNFAKITSVRASKINIEDVERNRPERILDLQPRIWLDRTDLKEALGDDYSDYVWAGNQYSGPTVDEEKLKNKLGYIPRRIPGLVAEEVVAAGLDEYAIYDEEEDGTETLQSISYDRLWTLLIPLVREQRDKIASQEERISDLEERLARLEAMMA